MKQNVRYLHRQFPHCRFLLQRKKRVRAFPGLYKQYKLYMLRIYLVCESILVDSLIYFSSLHPRFASLFQSSLLYIFRAYILALRVYFSQVSCIFFNSTSSLREFILVESLVYFSSLHHFFASIFQLSLLSILQAYTVALQVYFIRVKLNNLHTETDSPFD